MVVLAAVVCTKTGKALVSRQFVDISRVRLEGLLAAFPKLMGSGKQHTFIETESVRYVYQPLENLYMLLLTNKSSNILEDLETLHILAKIVPEYCRVLDEDEVSNKAFDLVFAFDEVIAVGYKEKVTIPQIKTFLEMDSHEEKIHEMLEKNKELEAKREAEKKRLAIERMKGERTGYSGISPSSGANWSLPTSSEQAAQPPQDPIVQAKEKKPSTPAATGSSAMKLAKKEATSKFLKDMEKEEGISLTTSSTRDTVAAATAPTESVNIDIVENVSVTLENEGGLKSFEVKGDLNITINESEYSQILLKLNDAENKAFNFKAHPNINKPRFTNDKVIALKPGKAFPTGNSLNVLKWRFATDDESLVPLTVNCWPTPAGDGSTIVNMEYELKNEALSLGDVRIAIPIIGSAPVVGEITGTFEFDVKKHVLTWKLDLIDDSNSTGAMEFTLNSADKTSFLPITVSFISRSTFCDIHVEQIVDADENQVQFSQTKILSTEDYTVV